MIKNKGKTNSICPVKKNNGEYATDEKVIREEWRANFESICTPNKNSQDDTFAKTLDEAVTSELANIKKDLNNTERFDIILPTEVDKISRSLKLNKACGYDNNSSEHLKYAINNTY